MPDTSPVYNKKHLKLLLFISIAFFIMMIWCFCFTGYIASHRSPLKIDATIFDWLQSARGSSMTQFMSAVTFCGSRYFLFPCYAVLVVYYLFFKKSFWVAVAIALTGFLGNQLLFFMQDIFQRQRPANPLINYVDGYGYPSGHSFASFVFAGLLSFLVWQQRLQTKWKLTFVVLLFLLASIIAVSRAYLRVHYSTDVVGGFYLSIAWLIPCLWILYFINNMYRTNNNKV